MVKLDLNEALRVESIKGPQLISIDGTKDFGGLGINHSPTELLCSSVASCMLIMIAKKAQEVGVDLTGTYANFNYTYGPGPKVSSMKISIYIPKVKEDIREILEIEAMKCPIHKSLSSQLKFTFNLNNF